MSYLSTRDGARLRVDVIADIVCPWCYIGKRRLERALAEYPADEVELTWRPYQLNPRIARGGLDRRKYLAEKFGGAERAEQIYREIYDAGLIEGITFNFEEIERTPNTVNAHRLIYFAHRDGRQEEMVEALYRAYFNEGQDIGQVAVLADIAATVGYPRAELLGYIIGGEDTGYVLEEDERARNLGVSGVPCFIVDRRYAVSGAQSPEVFRQIFDLVRFETPASVNG